MIFKVDEKSKTNNPKICNNTIKPNFSDNKYLYFTTIHNFNNIFVKNLVIMRQKD